ncbi:MAG: hypothetical protein ACE5IR_11310, partial [bacterium]
SGQVEILVPLWLGDTMVLAPGLGFIYVENVGMDVRLVLAPRFYLSMHRVAPYFGARVAVLLNLPDTGSNTTDFLIGAVFGGEYFVNPKFSFGVEAQVNGTISDNASTRFASPGAITISTGAAAHVNVYF